MKTQVWAHRGASAYAPENTMDAFELAYRQGADGIELDVQMTKDGKLVVIHDETIDRTSGESGYVREYTAKELRKFSFNQTHPEYKTAQIPFLEEVLEFVKSNGMKLNIELKNSIIVYPKLEEKVLALVKKVGIEEQVIYSSFNHKSIVKIKKLAPDAETGILYSDGWLRVPSYAEKIGVDAIHPAVYHVLDTKLIEKSHDKKLKVHIWTVNRREDMEIFTKRKADAIITNYPDICREVVDGK
ncbi:MAG: glycerophosphodiester phosphodiesterase [bacterium]|nr:glycerophosphodiester phosphodiesterase [bacterium]